MLQRVTAHDMAESKNPTVHRFESLGKYIERRHPDNIRTLGVMRRHQPTSAAVAEEDNIAFLDDVVFAFEAHLGFFFCGGDAACGEEIFAAYDFRANKAFLDVAVNFTGGFDSGGPFADTLAVRG